MTCDGLMMVCVCVVVELQSTAGAFRSLQQRHGGSGAAAVNSRVQKSSKPQELARKSTKVLVLTMIRAFLLITTLVVLF